jgi:hypothetical protein
MFHINRREHDQRRKETAVDRIKAALLELRTKLDKGFAPDTALGGFQGNVPSAGHCAAAAAIVWETRGGSFVSANVKGSSHWFNRIQINDQLFDCDVTGDQFGYPIVQVKPAEELYPHARERSPNELNEDTLRRAVLLACRSGFLQAAEAFPQIHSIEVEVRAS